MTRLFPSHGLLGLWDLRVIGLSMGGTLTLAADLHVEAAVTGDRVAGLCIIGDEAHTLSGLGPPATEPAALSETELTALPALRAAGALEGIDQIWYVGAGALMGGDDSTWPALSDTSGYRYTTTLHLSHRFRTNGIRPGLSLKREHRQWASAFVARAVAPSLPVAVHLRNAPRVGGGSNADLEAWERFFEARVADDRFRFVVVGNDPLPPSWRRLTNVVLTRDAGAGLEQDLALISAAYAFMGMASGPCNLAILSQVPYVVFKNPDDHPEHIQEEIGDGDTFPFAWPNQRLLRAWETPDGLEAALERIAAAVDRDSWERRFHESVVGEAGSG